MPAVIVDQALLARVIRQFNLRGNLEPFNLTENVVPVFDIGSLTGQDPTVVTTTADLQGVRVGTANAGVYVGTVSPDYQDANIVNSGAQVNPGAGQVLSDTGQLAGGTHNFHWTINSNAAAVTDFAVEWRDAANLVTLAIWTFFVGGTTESISMFNQFRLNLLVDERVRIVSTGAVVGTVNTTIGSEPCNHSIAV